MIKALACNYRLLVRLLTVALLGVNLGQVFHTRVSAIKQCNLVPVVGQHCPVAGKVTIDLARHWRCVTGGLSLSTYVFKA